MSLLDYFRSKPVETTRQQREVLGCLREMQEYYSRPIAQQNPVNARYYIVQLRNEVDVYLDQLREQEKARCKQ